MDKKDDLIDVINRIDDEKIINNIYSYITYLLDAVLRNNGR